MQTELRSAVPAVLVVKCWGPLILVIGALGVFGADFPTWKFLPAIPLLLLAIFHASVAVVEVRGGVIRYRRLFKWADIQSEEVLSARPVWPPLLGSIKLKRFVLPWGRLYFVLDKNRESNPFRRGVFPLVCYLNKEELHTDSQNSAIPSKPSSVSLRLLLSACVGILSCLMTLYLTPGDLLQGSLPKPTANMPTLLKILFQFVGWFHAPVAQVVAIAVITFLAVRRRNRPEAWVYGFISGFAFTLIVGRLLS